MRKDDGETIAAEIADADRERFGRLRRTRRAALVSALGYMLLCAYLVLLSAVCQSSNLLIGALLVFVRFVTSLLLIAGLSLSMRRSERFPEGLYKLENLVAALIGIAILVIAYELIKGAFYQLTRVPHVPRYHLLALSGLVVSLIVAAFFAWYKHRVAVREDSPSLLADARNSRADLFALIAITAGALIGAHGVKHMHGITSVLAGIYMIYIGVRVLYDAVKVLLDATVERSVLDQVRAVALSNPLVGNVVDVSGRNSGSFRLINLSLVVVTADLRQARRTAAEVDAEIRRRIPRVDHVSVEFEVSPRGEVLCAIPVAGDGTPADSLESSVELEVLRIDPGAGKVLNRERLQIPLPAGMPGRAVRLTAVAARRGLDAVLARTPPDDTDAVAALEEYGIALVTEPGATDLATAESALSGFASRTFGKKGSAGLEGAAAGGEAP